MTTFDAEGSGGFKRSTRMPLDAVVRLHFEGTVAYQNGFAANVSATGMFVKHPDPPPTGTRLVFEFVLGSQRRPVQGAGVVAWTRDRYEGPGRPAGIGIQFTQVDSASRQHIAEALFEYLEASLGEELIQRAGEELGLDAGEIAAAEKTMRGLEAPQEGGVEAARPPEAPASPSLFDERPSEPTRPPAPPRFELAESEEASRPAAETDEQRIDRMVREALEEEASIAGAAVAGSRRSGSAMLWIGAAAAVVLIAAGGWALWRYGFGGSPPAPRATATAAPTPTPTPRPPLAADLGPVSTLAETVGASSAQKSAPEPPLPAAVPPREAAAAVEGGAAGAPSTAPERSETAGQPAASEVAERTQPEAAAAEPAGAPRATRLDEIEWTEATGTTVVTLSGDGPFPAGSYGYFEMGGDKPRVLIKLRGLDQPYRRGAIAVGTSAVVGIRTGWHLRETGNEQHVVVDLAPGGARLDGFEAVGSRIVLKLAPR